MTPTSNGQTMESHTLQVKTTEVLGYGMGYALAKDHYCVLIDQIIRIRGERSKYHGEEHLDADFGWKAYGLVQMSEDNFQES